MGWTGQIPLRGLRTSLMVNGSSQSLSPFLLEKPGFRSKSSTNLICGICEGDLDQQAVPLYLVGITAVHLRMLFSLSLWHLFVSHGCKVLLVLGLQS